MRISQTFTTSFPIGRLLCALISLVIIPLSTASAAANDTDDKDLHPLKPRRPNIVLIYADDVDCETVFGKFPEQDIPSMRFDNLRKLALDGRRFSNFHVTTPVCGPSRACLYTGQYAHHNGCRVNDPRSIRAYGFNGGFKTFNPENELASWMKNAGYSTAHVGKYLHSDFKPDYANGIEWKDIIPKGWDHFRLSLGCRYLGFPSYVKSTNKFHQTSGKEYRTDWDIRNAIDVLNKHAKGSDRAKPIMLCWSPIAAHITGNGQPMVAPRHKSMYSTSEIPGLSQRLGEKVHGQIDTLKVLEAPNAQLQQYLTDVYRDRLRAIKSIDEGVGALRTELKKLGMLKNTVFIFTSDHGYRFAQHRHYGKRLPYDRITRVPFIVSGPGIPKNCQSDELLANIDIAPTLVALAGENCPESCDGQSFKDLLFGSGQETLDREAIVIENWGEAVSLNVLIPATYSSIRMKDSIYTEWASGGCEFYDLSSDPEQLRNLYSDLGFERQSQLAAMLRNHRKTNSAPALVNTRRERGYDSKRICASIRPVVFSGIVEADAGIENVQLEFRCRTSGEYWTDSGWSSSPQRFTADLKQPNGLTSEWTFGLDTSDYASKPTSNIAAREVELSVLATDLQDRQTLKKSLTFKMGFADPETSIIGHRESEDGKNLIIFGVASDLKKVKCVRVGFQHPVTRQYWDGTKWSKEYCHHQTEDATEEELLLKNREWEVSIPKPDAEQLILVARAYSPSKHFDHSPAVETITLESSEPVASISQALTENSK